MVNQGLSSEDVQRASVYQGTAAPAKPAPLREPKKKKRKLGLSWRDVGDVALGMVCGAGLDALMPNVLEDQVVRGKCIEAVIQSLPYGMGVLMQSGSPRRAVRSTGNFMIGSLFGQTVFHLAVYADLLGKYFQ